MPSQSQSDRDYLLVGVTGGIGSGKSTVCALFAELGRTVISADLLAREITETDRSVRAEIRREFGGDVFDQNGALIRQRLAEVVFRRPLHLKKLNRIVHPRVFEALNGRLEALPAAARTPYVIIEAALVYESRMDRMLDAVIVVHAPLDVRVKRVVERDHCTSQDVLDRVQSQMDPELLLQKSTFQLENSTDISRLGPKVLFLDRLLALMSPANRGPS